MTNELVNFIPDIQSINPQEYSGFVLFCESSKLATAIQRELQESFHIHAITDSDNNEFNYVIPLSAPDNKMLSNFIRRGWNYDNTQKFVKYTITLYNADTTTKLYDTLTARGFNVNRMSNDMQLIVHCLDNSLFCDTIQNLRNALLTAQKTQTQTIDDYFNKILFNGKVEDTQYRTTRKEFFDITELEQNKDIIIRGIMYQYFFKRVRPYLENRMFPKKFDANKMDDKLKRNIILVRDYLYAMTEKYINTQILNAANTHHDVIVRFDYLKSCNEYKDVHAVVKRARDWQKSETNISKNADKFYRESERGSYKVMDLDNGYYVAQLFSPESLDFESDCMNHCAGDGYYDNQVHRADVQIYSVRNKRGLPQLTLEVNNGIIVQAQGHGNRVPNDPALRAAVRKFMYAENLEIPDVNGWNKLIAYIKQDGKMYDVFDLPKNFVANHTINLSGMDLNKLPDMSTVTIYGDFWCPTNNLFDAVGAPGVVYGHCKFSGNPLQSLRGFPRIVSGQIYLSRTQLTPKSFVPMYMEKKLDDIIGIDEKTIAAWREQIANRKTKIANIVAALNNHVKE